MAISCIFCGYNVSNYDGKSYRPTHTLYECPKCGHIHLTRQAADDFNGERFSEEEKTIISICVRNEFEIRGRSPLKEPMTLDDIHQFIKQYRPPDPLDKLDIALQNIERACEYVGESITVDIENDYPYYHCLRQQELYSLLVLLQQQGLVEATEDKPNPHRGLRITTKGYQKLDEIKRHGKDSRKCFVAMWLAPEMDTVYEKAIKPAIEYKEEGEDQPRFEAVRIDNVEHTNDINDEIIAAIRRSRFMVCDLTGYRGGVYFEAGFAYGLGLEVIYTCREDWLKKTKKKIVGNDGREYTITQEGIHFDLEHRNRIQWKPKLIDDFRKKLTKRIKAVIV